MKQPQQEQAELLTLLIYPEQGTHQKHMSTKFQGNDHSHVFPQQDYENEVSTAALFIHSSPH
jgi:hypothetical protein